MLSLELFLGFTLMFATRILFICGFCLPWTTNFLQQTDVVKDRSYFFDPSIILALSKPNFDSKKIGNRVTVEEFGTLRRHLKKYIRPCLFMYNILFVLGICIFIVTSIQISQARDDLHSFTRMDVILECIFIVLLYLTKLRLNKKLNDFLVNENSQLYHDRRLHWSIHYEGFVMRLDLEYHRQNADIESLKTLDQSNEKKMARMELKQALLNRYTVPVDKLTKTYEMVEIQKPAAVPKRQLFKQNTL